MSLQTLIIASSPLLAVFQEAAENSACTVTQLGENLYLSSWRWSDIESYVETDLVGEPVSVGVTLDEDGEEVETLFDPANTQPQELTSSYLLNLKRDDEAGLFFPPIVEPEPEPRYKEYMTQAEFIRNLITEAEWEAIAPLAQADPTVWAWCFTTNAGDVWVKHPSFEAGMQMGIAAGIWDQSRADEISKGLLIT